MLTHVNATNTRGGPALACLSVIWVLGLVGALAAGCSGKKAWVQQTQILGEACDSQIAALRAAQNKHLMVDHLAMNTAWGHAQIVEIWAPNGPDRGERQVGVVLLLGAPGQACDPGQLIVVDIGGTENERFIDRVTVAAREAGLKCIVLPKSVRY